MTSKEASDESAFASLFGFIGSSRQGPPGWCFITSWSQYRDIHCGGRSDEVTALDGCVAAFFRSGGRAAYIYRVVGIGAATAAVNLRDGSTLPLNVVGVEARAASPGTWGNQISINISAGTRTGLRIQVQQQAGPDGLERLEDYDNVVVEADDDRNWLRRVRESKIIDLVQDFAGRYDPEPGRSNLVGGSDGDSKRALKDLFDRPMEALAEGMELVDFLYVPDIYTGRWSHVERQLITDQLVKFCEDQLVVALVAPRPDPALGDLLAPTDSPNSLALWPWVTDMQSEALVPAIPYLAGAMSASDVTRGVHKSPVGETVPGIRLVEFQGDHDLTGEELARRGLSSLKESADGRVSVETFISTSTKPGRSAIADERFTLYVIRSIIHGLGWIETRERGDELWEDIAAIVSDFFRRLWMKGALVGSSLEEACWVKCDAETNPPDAVDAGATRIEIGLVLPSGTRSVRINHDDPDSWTSSTTITSR